ncbi:MAG TPA: lactate utilization protein [Verrucomicrobiae bacterium]|nr:lactate utilization protein [Verrucomicrobiae bacterium]
MTNREIILGRIREALKVAAPHPAFPGGPAGTSPLPASPQKWLPPVGETLEEQIELFGRNAEDLKATFRICPNISEATQHVKALAAEGGWKKIGLHSGEWTDAIARELGLVEVRTDGGYAVNDLESCDAGLTECEALVAQTGSVLVSAPSAGGRALSVLPPHHVVLAQRSQMVPDLTAALQRVQEKFIDNFPSFLSFISGPSRTGDIERILVLGAHGPKKLTILLLP